MTVNDYEKQNGFREELQLVREIGGKINLLIEKLPARPHRNPELDALYELRNANDKLREEIGKTRNG